MMRFTLLILCINLFPFIIIDQERDVLISTKGTAKFRSEAPLELIQASSDQLRGAIDLNDHTFAFRLQINSFDGFNSQLQKEHFRENYMETSRFPEAIFAGKIIEKIQFTENGKHQVRAKGFLDIHGIKQERIIKCSIEIEGNRILVKSDFSVFLKDHNIDIPKIVYQKIAEEILVGVEAQFEMQ
ncbi:YceI family protein [Fulvivirgaceae bacterium BMA10]|uniref:YceI family protein n=1 Tax=Splendidivirga corallicola TaxID=3051826 RepID=A0ABT8KKX5_9BACT|nr:YceI family protein [Fulvivirgaceae bacterium BMA10]